MILLDTSAWVELLRKTESPVHHTFRELLLEDAELAVTEPVIMEVLAGARSAREESELKQTLLGFAFLSLGGLRGFEVAAGIHRACRSGGESLRGLVDCLVAAAAIRADASVLHADRDFDVIARHTPLRIETARAI